MNNKLGVIIGRFQNYNLHDGHIHLYEKVINDSNVLLVLIGDNDTIGTKNNPLDFETRKLMIENFLRTKEVSFEIKRIKDVYDDVLWSNNVDQLISESVYFNQNDTEVILYGSRQSFIPYYSGIYKTLEIETPYDKSSTKLREQVKNPILSEEFRLGMIYQANLLYPKVWATVDVIIKTTFKNKTYFLLGKKRNSNRYVLCGGFSDPEDLNYEYSALRELYEETHIVVEKLKYLFSMKIDDFRYKNEVDKIITNVFLLELDSHRMNEAIAGDDLETVLWIEDEELINYNIFEPHKQIIQKFLTENY